MWCFKIVYYITIVVVFIIFVELNILETKSLLFDINKLSKLIVEIER